MYPFWLLLSNDKRVLTHPEGVGTPKLTTSNSSLNSTRASSVVPHRRSFWLRGTGRVRSRLCGSASSGNYVLVNSRHIFGTFSEPSNSVYSPNFSCRQQPKFGRDHQLHRWRGPGFGHLKWSYPSREAGIGDHFGATRQQTTLCFMLNHYIL